MGTKKTTNTTTKNNPTNKEIHKEIEKAQKEKIDGLEAINDMVVNNRSRAIENIYDLRKENEELNKEIGSINRRNSDIMVKLKEKTNLLEVSELKLEAEEKSNYCHNLYILSMRHKYNIIDAKLKDEELRYGRYRRLLFQIYALTILTMVFIQIIR